MGSASNVGDLFISSLHSVFSLFVVSFFLRFLYIVLLDLAPPFALICSGAAAAAAGRVSLCKWSISGAVLDECVERNSFSTLWAMIGMIGMIGMMTIVAMMAIMAVMVVIEVIEMMAMMAIIGIVGMLTMMAMVGMIGMMAMVAIMAMRAMIGVMAMITMVVIKSLSSEGRSLPSPHDKGEYFIVVF